MKIVVIKNILKISIMTCFGLLVTMCFVPVFFPSFVLFFLISRFVVILIKFHYGRKAHKANGTDVLSGKETQESYPIINVGFRFRGEMDPSKFRNRILNVVNKTIDDQGYKRYRRLMQVYKRCYGYHIWKEYPEFNIDEHIRTVTYQDIGLDQEEFEGDQECSWQILMKKFLDKYGGERVQAGIPQWELLLFKENDQRYSAIFRFHHCIADGIYVSRMLCEEFLDSPTKLFHTYTPPTTFAKVLIKLWSFCLLPFGLWKIICNNDKNALHGPNLTGEKRYYVSKSIPLSVLRDIRMKTNTSIHAVLFSCLSSAIASHFVKRNCPTNEITTLIPMPLQNLQKPIELKNRYAVVSLKIPTLPSTARKQNEQVRKNSYPELRLRSLNPLTRLELIKSTLLKAKRDPTFISVHSLITAFCSFLPARLSEALLSTKGCSVAFSNLPGPQETIHFGTDRIEEVMFWIPDRAPMGVGMSILSYDGHLRAGLSFDRALLKDEAEGEMVVKQFEKEVDDILQSLEESGRSFMKEQETEELLRHIP